MLCKESSLRQDWRRELGTPERTLTSDLPLRRRTLYTTELLGHIFVIVTKNKYTVNKS